MTDKPDLKDSHASDRRFRRYHRAQQRRRKAELADARFSKAVFSLAGVAAAIAIGLGVLALNGGAIDPESAASLTEPWIGPASRVEVFGLGFIAFMGGLFFWRIRKR